ncbi:partial NAD(P) transhydrogenase, partial [biofilm metagenome]
AEMVKSMKPGSVVVDLAAEQGGNCELTEKDKVAVKHGVTLIGYTDLPSRLANQSSQLYATNLRHFLTDLTPTKDGKINVNMDDEVIRGATVVKDGKITWPPPPPALSVAPAAKQETAAPVAAAKKSLIPEPIKQYLPLILGGLALYWVGLNAPPAFMSHFTVFVLACFIGYQVIWNVTPALHTPLMSVTNAISGIIVIGALVQISAPGFLITVLAGLAVLIASINIAGGFLVTRRMLEMFRK